MKSIFIFLIGCLVGVIITILLMNVVHEEKAKEVLVNAPEPAAVAPVVQMNDQLPDTIKVSDSLEVKLM